VQIGAVHVHSTYSDGEFTLTELRAILSEAGCTFVCLADHAEAFTQDRLAAYHSECEHLSDPQFLMLPGLEYECRRRMHILGLGITSPVHSDDPEEVIRHVADCGGLSVIAHPKDDAFGWIESFQILPDGIEVWNSKYDGRYAPRPWTFRLLHRLQERRAGLRAYYGQDLHWRHQPRTLMTALTSSVQPREILSAMTKGEFVGVMGDLRLPSTGQVSDIQLQEFERRYRRAARFRQIARGAGRLLNRVGGQLPSPLKAQLRRLF
jgi:hypothetical protein